jgi:hypothetical protein
MTRLKCQVVVVYLKFIQVLQEWNNLFLWKNALSFYGYDFLIKFDLMYLFVVIKLAQDIILAGLENHFYRLDLM